MYRRFLTISMVCLMAVLVLMVPKGADAQDKITGPWLWMIAPTEAGQGGFASTDVDSLAAASGGAVTEADVAANGADIGEVVGNYAWTLSTIGIGFDNVTDVVQRIGWADSFVIDHSSYALITLESINAQNNVTMRVGSDDSIKVWLNGEVVHTNAINRGSNDFEDNFPVNLRAGDNLLLVKVSQRGGGWGMYVGIDADVNAVYKPPTTSSAQDPSLILYLSFDELNGTRVTDHSQYGNHGTVIGNRQLVAGRFGNALTFNGESDYVEIPHHNSLTVDTSVTVMAWIHTPRAHDPLNEPWQGIIAKDNDLRSYNFYTEAGARVHLSIGNGVGNPCCVGSGSEGTFALNTWQHVVAQHDSNGVQRFWINGERAGTFQVGGTLPGIADTASVLVGKTHEDNREFLGMIDEVRVWNRALSEAEILEQMAIGRSGGLTFTPSEFADQTFTLGAPVSLTLPMATGGSPPYNYSIPALPPGLQFDPTDRSLSGIPTTLGTTPVTYTATDTTGASTSLTFTITVQDTPSLTDVYMYWTDHSTNKIQRANLDGTNVQDILTGFGRPVGIAVDITGGKMYWTDRDRGDHRDPAGQNSIHRANLDGTAVETLVLGDNAVKEYIALDVSGGKMYWTEYSHFSNGRVRRANLDGTNVEDIVPSIAGGIGIALDLSQGKVYYGGWGDKIQRANLDGSNIEDILSTPNSNGIALDVAGSKIYWSEPEQSKIRRANLDGTNPEDLVTGLRIPTGIALDISQGKIYWVDRGEGDKIQRADLDGTNIEDLVTGLTSGAGIALGIPQTPFFRLNPNVVANRTFTVGTAVNLTLPVAVGGTPPYDYTLAPTLPAGLYFDPIANGPGYIGGTPTAVMPSTPFTYTVVDAAGASVSLTFTITVETDGLNLDVNGDGQVDVLDLVWTAVAYGIRGTGLPADVNADGVVDIQDLMEVAEGIDTGEVLPAEVAEEVLLAAEAAAAELQGVAGAPVIGFNTRQHMASGLTAYRNVAAALSDVRALRTGDVRLGKWLPLLEELLQVLAEMRAIPDQTALLPNYPNPFNPETWIPYHLAKAANVTLTIYDVRGRVVRELTLGHQSAGVYESRGRAAYWDGRNQLGEPVASGLYFYTLTAGEFNATRKLLIAK